MTNNGHEVARTINGNLGESSYSLEVVKTIKGKEKTKAKERIKVKSVNIQGLNNEKKQRQILIGMIVEKADIYVLTECQLKASKKKGLKKLCKHYDIQLHSHLSKTCAEAYMYTIKRKLKELQN